MKSTGIPNSRIGSITTASISVAALVALVLRPQPRADLAGGDISLLQQFAHGEEAVELAGKVPVGDRYAGFFQSRRVFVAFVAQGVGAGGQHIGRRQTLQRGGARGRG